MRVASHSQGQGSNRPIRATTGGSVQVQGNLHSASSKRSPEDMNNEKPKGSENMQDESLSTIILDRISKASLVPTIAITIIVSAILYFANSREFYFVQSEDQIRDSKYKIIPPSDHLIRSGEDYPIHVMARRPLKGLTSTTIPITICLIHVLIVMAYKKEGEPVV